MATNTIHDDQIVVELLDLIILNEFLRKDLLSMMSDYVKEFDSQAIFDYSRPVSYIDFYGFVQKNDDIESGLKFKQFFLNLELFVLKFYRMSEVSKKYIKDTKLKKLRQTYSHRTSSDILNGRERLVIFGGLTYDFSTFLVQNMTDQAESVETIEYYYSKYIDLILEHYPDEFSIRIKNVKQLRALNENFIKELFPDRIK